MTQPVLTEATETVLREAHPDPFTQGAIWRLYVDAPGLLDSAIYVRLASAQDLTPDQIMERRQAAMGQVVDPIDTQEG